MLEIVRANGYREVVAHSASKWKDGWPFYDKFGFQRVGQLTEYDGIGQIWRIDLSS